MTPFEFGMLGGVLFLLLIVAVIQVIEGESERECGGCYSAPRHVHFHLHCHFTAAPPPAIPEPPRVVLIDEPARTTAIVPAQPPVPVIRRGPVDFVQLTQQPLYLIRGEFEPWDPPEDD